MNNNLIKEPTNMYFQGFRVSLAESFLKGSNRVLDVGCGAGNFGAFLKQQGYASEVVGIEINRQVADEALTKLDQVFCADLNCITVSNLFSQESMLFDYRWS